MIVRSLRTVAAVLFFAFMALFATAAHPHHRVMNRAIQTTHFSTHDRVRMVVLGDSLAYGTGATSPKNGYAYRVFAEIQKTHAGSTYANFDLTSRMKKSDRVRFLSTDHLHPSDAGYAEIAKAAIPVVREALR